MHDLISTLPAAAAQHFQRNSCSAPRREVRLISHLMSSIEFTSLPVGRAVSSLQSKRGVEFIVAAVDEATAQQLEDFEVPITVVMAKSGWLPVVPLI